MEHAIKRDEHCYGIDLLKAISMFMVVVLHVLGQGGILYNSTSWNHRMAWLMETGAYCAVNCFAMTTGYLMTGKTFRYRKIVPLWLTVAFYSAALMVVGAVFFPGSVDVLDIYKIFPVTAKNYWYFSSYFCLFFFIPFLNFLIDHLPEKQLRILLLTGFVLFSGLYVLSPENQNPFAMGIGYNPWWLMYLYLLGAGIKKYGLFSKISAKKALLGYVGAVAVTLLIESAIAMLMKLEIPKIAGMIYTYGKERFISYRSPTIVASGVFLMMFCLKISVPRWLHKPLKWLAPLVFQVYIIHVHFVIWDKLDGRFVSYAEKPLPVMVLLVLGTAGAIFVGCVLIDWLRHLLFRLLKVNQWVDWLADKAVNIAKKTKVH